jgi:TonB family protein
MKKILVVCWGLIQCSLAVKSQEKVIIFYNANWEVTQKNKASFYREAEFDFSNFKLQGRVVDHFLTDSVLMVGEYFRGKRNGEFKFYYDNGQINCTGSYSNNKRVGKWVYYYENGHLKQVVLFPQTDNELDFRVGEYYDRNGLQLVKNGTGKWTNDSIHAGVFDPFSLKKVTGPFKDSLKNGVWRLTRIADKVLMHSESFKRGKFIDATVFNTQFNYIGTIGSEVVDKFPDTHRKKFLNTENFKLDTTAFAGSLVNADVETIFKTITGKDFKITSREGGYIDGDFTLFQFIAGNINYPISALERRLQGTVYVLVTIDPSGDTKEVKILRGVQKEMDNEAARVISLVKRWLPAIQNGKAIESAITIPVKFQIRE